MDTRSGQDRRVTYAWRQWSGLRSSLALALVCRWSTQRDRWPAVLSMRTAATPIAGAEITIVGQRGSVRTDGDGRFQWPITPPMPIDVDRRASPMAVSRGRSGSALANDAQELDPRRRTRRSVNPSWSLGAAPTIDVSPAASTTLLTSRDLELRHPSDLEPGARRRTRGEHDLGRSSGGARDSRPGARAHAHSGRRQPGTTERRAGSNASFLDPGVVRTIEVARGPGSVAYGSDAFGGVIAARTRGPDYDEAMGRAVSPGLRVAACRSGAVNWRSRRGYGTGGLIVGVRARDFDDYDAPSGVVTNSGWRDRGVRARWEHATNDDSVVRRLAERYRSRSRPAAQRQRRHPGDQPDRGFASADGVVTSGVRSAGSGMFGFDALVGALRQRNDQERLATPTRPRSIERADLSSARWSRGSPASALVGRARAAHRRRHPGTLRPRGAGHDARPITWLAPRVRSGNGLDRATRIEPRWGSSPSPRRRSLPGACFRRDPRRHSP